ncbi:MAG: DUF3578 domain-containing protein [Armatimonadetes bacterium]|nr:DUF3578 domain-containing protein [Armatimonadota bacterium]
MTGDRAALDPPTVSSFVGWLETVFVWHPKCRYEAGAFLPFEAWFRRGKELAASLRPVRERLDDLSRPPLIVQASIGKAKTFTNTPWLGLRYNRATRNYYEGVFVQFLFCADMSGVYLQLTHGVGESGEAKEGSARPRREVIEEVTVLRDRFAGSQPLKAAGFGLMPPMNLHIPVGRSRVPSQYPDVTITYKFYRRDRLSRTAGAALPGNTRCHLAGPQVGRA